MASLERSRSLSRLLVPLFDVFGPRGRSLPQILSPPSLWWGDVLGLWNQARHSAREVSAVHLRLLCTAPSLSDETRMRQETCIICNRYRSLMVSALPMAAHNGPFLRFSHLVWLFDGDGMGTAGVTWEERRRRVEPCVSSSGSWHCFLLTCRAYKERSHRESAENNKRRNCPSKRVSLSFMWQKHDKMEMSHFWRKWLI